MPASCRSTGSRRCGPGKVLTASRRLGADNLHGENMQMTKVLALAGVIALSSVAQAQTDRLQGKTYRAPGGTTLRLMLDENNLGGEVTLGEMVFPANSDSGDHKH